MAECICERLSVTLSIDVGTTYSCAAIRGERWCRVHGAYETVGPDLIAKHPTALTSGDNDDFSYVQPLAHHENEHIFRYFKIFMSAPHDLQRFQIDMANVSGITQALNRCGTQNPVTMFSRYLIGLYESAAKRFPVWSDRSIDRKLVFTFPALFCDTPETSSRLDQVTDALRRHTGLEVRTMLEHEAAVRGALLGDARFLSSQNMAKAALMVGDVGGATLDAGVYNFNDPRCESGIPLFKSAMLGTMLLDAAFLTALQRKFIAIDREAAQPNGEIAPEVDQHILSDWEVIKRHYYRRIDVHRRWKFHDRRRHLRTEFNKEEMSAIFDDFADRVGRQLVTWWREIHQQGCKPEVLFITGGISQSSMFREKVKSTINKDLPAEFKGDFFEVLFVSNCKESESKAWHVVGLGGALIDKSIHDLFRAASNRYPS